jgi:serine/threonine protein phosphatase PrpC
MSLVIAAAATHVGKVRKHNEDSHLIDPHERIFIVADGMGGHAAGEVASEAAIRIARQQWTTPAMAAVARAYAQRGDAERRRRLLEAVRNGVMRAHDEIIDEASKDHAKAGMGTTFTGFLIAGGDAVFAHAGDSRAYLVRDDIAMQLSEDHTLLARLEASGMTAKQRQKNSKRWKGVLTNALGIGDATRVATFIVPLCSGDRLLLCSDGITEYVNESELGQILVSAPSPARASQRLVDMALDRGGGDNATAIVVKVVEADETTVPADQRDREKQAMDQCAIFEDLTLQERLRALRIMTTREVKPGKQLLPIALGNRVSYVVLSGRVELPGQNFVGPGAVVYPGALVEDSVMPDRHSIATVADTCRMLTIRQDDFFELTEDDDELAVKLFNAVAKLMRG